MTLNAFYGPDQVFFGNGFLTVHIGSHQGPFTDQIDAAWYTAAQGMDTVHDPGHETDTHAIAGHFKAMTDIGFISVAADFLPTLKPKEYFRPAQVDQHGNFNNIAFGSNYHKPRLRLPGTGGIPDVTTFLDNIFLYVPRHSRVTFVEKLDYLSGMGHNPRRVQGAGTRALISDFGCFDFHKGTMRLVSYHPMVTPERIQARTGFKLDIRPDVAETPPPSDEEK